MAINAVLTDTEAVISTATTVVLGYASGQTTPPRVYFANSSSSVSITLQAIPPTLASATGGNYLPGAENGYQITVFNVGSGTVTVAAASGDTLGGTATIAQNAARTWCSLSSTKTWYQIANNL